MTARKSGFIVGAVAGAGVACAALAGVGMRMGTADAAEAQVVRANVASAPAFAPPPGAPMSFADIFEKVSPAVVQINVTSKASPQPLRIPGFEGFDIVPRGKKAPGQGQDGEDGDAPATPKQQSAGSGFFISADGYIVTNNHVVADADDIQVVMKDGRELKATLVGRDEGTDLAVIKVVDPKAKNAEFPYVDFENQAKPRVGDWVITIGNPFGLGGTATAGIISAYGRNLGDTTSSFVNYIQIDAPINRGNSGGPSFDIYGRVIGVNSAIYSPSGGSVGIGFAIPADIAEATAKQLISSGKVVRGYIGVSIQDFSAEMAEAQGLKDVKGAIVAEVIAGGPAAKAGLLPDDILVGVNGVKVADRSELTREVSRARPGEIIKMSILRDGKPRVIDIKSGVRPSENALAANDDDQDQDGAGAPTPDKPATQRIEALGLTLAPIDAAARQTYKIDSEIKGLLITSVKGDSDAGEKGLAKGDVLANVNGAPVTSAADVNAAVATAKKAGRTSVLVKVIRQNRPVFVPLKIAP
ncbi:Do family serine endopeptidase [Caulobacter segnis]|uniref:Do family serine endopeptidase n=1 Tax=Caulobacter segnis TaxID=88688 RepID=UPI002859FBD8|nr:Do family serine endopeptidase [Caulobacter segnis]MDR6623765.1 serine protease Do [Caulobacter segnis]